MGRGVKGEEGGGGSLLPEIVPGATEQETILYVLREIET